MNKGKVISYFDKRTKQGYIASSITQLAKVLKVHRNTISGWLAGNAYYENDTCLAFWIDKHELIKGLPRNKASAIASVGTKSVQTTDKLHIQKDQPSPIQQTVDKLISICATRQQTTALPITARVKSYQTALRQSQSNWKYSSRIRSVAPSPKSQTIFSPDSFPVLTDHGQESTTGDPYGEIVKERNGRQ